MTEVKDIQGVGSVDHGDGQHTPEVASPFLAVIGGEILHPKRGALSYRGELCRLKVGVGEARQLGVAAYRCGSMIDWDPKALRAKNTDAAEKYLKREEYRKGWEIDGMK